MIFSLDVLRARKGDCFIIHFGSKSDPGLALIDGGPGHVYKKALKPRLLNIRKIRGLTGNKSLPIDLLMVSHIDDDHINGILDLTKDLVTAQDSNQPLPFKIRNLWHNSFDDIIGNKPNELLSAITASFGTSALSGELNTGEIDSDVAGILSSIGQGIRLRDDVRKLRLRVNPEFGGNLVVAKDDREVIDFGKGLKFTVIGPMQAEVVALQKKHDAFLISQNKKNTEAMLASFTDTSVANLSSLVVLAEVADKRILLTGDARGDKILQGLELSGLLNKNGEMHVDILKVPHHGSSRNIDPVFFKRVTASHYVFSGNGEHGNPERETLQMLLDERGDQDYKIHFTYPVQEIDAEREKDWEKEQRKEIARKRKNHNVIVRKDWSPKDHSLTFLVETNKKFARMLNIVKSGEDRVIDLLDKF